MDFDNKLDSLNERKRDVERELAGIADAKPGSDNTALADLEHALMGELDHIQNRIGQLQSLIDTRQVSVHTSP